jgi:CRISPR-associated protein Cmr1
LELEYPAPYEKDVYCAVWAWVNFGGIGARTRRGCGTLWCRELSPSVKDDLRSWYEERLREYGLSSILAQKRRAWPTLPPPSGVVVSRDVQQPGAAWLKAVQVLQWFRQPRTDKRPGRTPVRWPEAESVRRLRQLKGQVDPGKPPAFPKAELGLPIVMRAGKREIGTLVGPSTGRRASPVIVKAWALTGEDQQPKARASVVRLTVPPLRGVRLDKVVGIDTQRVFGPETLRPPSFQYPGSDGQGPKASNAVDVFMSFVAAAWSAQGGARR